MRGKRWLGFRCTGCGNCCRDPLLPLTDDDLRRLVDGTRASWRDLVGWVPKSGIDLDDGRWFVLLRQGLRTMVLLHRRGRCVYLGADDRCTAYASRPLGCRVFPLDPEFSSRGALRRLQLIEATDCPYELDGRNDVEALRELHQEYEQANDAYLAQVAAWNRRQRTRIRAGHRAQTASEYLAYLGF